ncbi:MAG: leucine-rich repeat domain-containing protein, partial [Planctomycetota bacterium]
CKGASKRYKNSEDRELANELSEESDADLGGDGSTDTEIVDLEHSTECDVGSCVTGYSCVLGRCLQECERVVEFPDEALEAAIRERIGKPEDDILAEYLLEVDNFQASEKGISDLAGIQCMTGLKFLLLRDNNISDIRPIFSLASLRQLVLDGNRIDNLEPLSMLPSLSSLALSRNMVSDLEPISGLVTISSLELDENRITDIGPLSKLSALVILSIKDNGIVDLSALSDLLRIGSLDLRNNRIKTINTYFPQVADVIFWQYRRAVPPAGRACADA